MLMQRHTVSVAPASLLEVLGVLRAQTGVRFIYSPSSLPADQLVEISAKDEPLSAILDQLLAPLHIEYERIGRQIALRWAPPAQRKAYTQTIRGTVIDHDTQTPLIGANVVVASLDPFRGASTDENGNFEIPGLPLGRHAIIVQYIGYDPAHVSQLLLTAGKELVLDIALIPSPVNMEMVLVSDAPDLMIPLNEAATVSARSFSVEQTQRYAASLSDPARMAQSFSGVSRAEDDLLNEVIVRGQSPKYTVWQLEGIEIPNPNHFGDGGHSSGGISMFSANVLTYSDFLSGAFPAEYGNALAGVFDLNMRKGNSERSEYTIGVGSLGLEGTMEGPIGEQGGSYLVNYRYSTLGLMADFKIIPNDEIAYEDVAFKFHLPTRKLGVFTIFGLGGTSYFHDKEESLSCECVNPPFSDNDLKEADEGDERKGVVGISNFLPLSSTTFLKTTVAAFGKSELESTYVRSQPINNEKIYADEELEEESGIRAKLKFAHRPNERHLLEAGVTGSLLWLTYRFRTRDFDPYAPWNYQIYAKEPVNMGRGFLQWTYRPNTRWSFNAGVHSTYFSVNKERTFEPRMGVKWQLAQDKTLSFGTGIHSQIEPFGIYLLENTRQDSIPFSNRDLQLSKSWHNVLAFEKLFAGNTRFRSEIYYNHGYDIPVADLPGSTFSAVNTYFLFNVYASSIGLSNAGTTTNYGLDLSLEKLFSNGYYFMLNGSLFDAKYSTIDGHVFPSRYNTRFMTNLVTGIELNMGPQKRDVLGINTRIMFGGGNRYTPLEVTQLDNGINIRLNTAQRYSQQLDPYFRVDFGINYTINKPFLTHQVYLDVQNVIHRKNEGFLEYDIKKQSVNVIPQLGILPMLGYRLTF